MLTYPVWKRTNDYYGNRQKSGRRAFAGVNIRAKGGTVGVVSDNAGKYQIQLPSNEGELIFSYIGFQTQEIAISNKSVIDVTMEPVNSSLQGVVIIGYGSQSRDKVTTAVSKLDNKVLENVPYADATSAMQGTLPGVRVRTSSGLPGTSPSVIVRGGTSINNPNGATPLYIVDGVQRSDLRGINAADIASLQVLKDAASTSIYGALGSNGVVIVTTKSGKAGPLQVNYRVDLTVSQMMRDFHLLNAEQYIYYQRLGIAADAELDPSAISKLSLPSSGGTGNDLTNNTTFTPQYLTSENAYKLREGWDSMPDPIYPDKTIIFQNTNWRDLLFRTAFSQDHNISASGGNERATFSTSLGYTDDQGIAIFTGFRRYTFNMNGSLHIRDNLKVFGRLMYTHAKIDSIISFSGAIPIPNTTKYRFEDGTLAPGNGKSQGNVAYQRSREVTNFQMTYLTMVAGLHWDILDGLSFDPQVSFYEPVNDFRFFQKSYYNTPTQFIDSRAANASIAKQLQKQVDAVFSYVGTFHQAHHVDAKLGFSYVGRNSYQLQASGMGASTDLIPTLNASATPVSVNSFLSNRNLIGFFSRINYDYREKYLLSVNARYDGASNLGTANKWGLFPGVSLGWNMHKEDFWQISSQVVSQLKLRASYGVNGNIGGLGDYQSQGAYSVGLLYGGHAAIQNTILANPDLKWERSKTFDVGLDMGLLENRVSLTLDYYHRITDNLLTNISLPYSSGFPSILSNYGSLQNNGMEMAVTYDILPRDGRWQWTVAANAAQVHTHIVKLPYNGVENNRVGGYNIWDAKTKAYTWQGGLQEGGRIGDLFAYKQLGVYATDEEAAQGPKDMLLPGADKTKRGGDVEFQDTDGNGIIDQKDMVYVGNPYPTWTGGFTNVLSYGKLSLLIRMDFALGHTIYDYWQAAQIGQFGGDLGLSTDLLRSWKKQGDVTDIPRYYWADQQARNNVFRGNSKYYVPGDYLAFREATLSYDWTPDFLKRHGISNINVHLTGSNLHYFTKLKIMNPEVDVALGNTYPIPRNFIFGVHITF